jgi:ferredoxin-NADP reductase
MEIDCGQTASSEPGMQRRPDASNCGQLQQTSASMTTYRTSLQGRDEIATATMAFRFAKPPGFAFKAGQALDVVLAHQPTADPQSARHTFSIVSAPSENELVVATRMRDSAFKRALKALPIDSSVAVDGPFGALTLHKNHARPAIFIAGGIGITPFMSMLRQATQERSPQKLLLLYSNRRPEDAAFLAELQQLERRSETFRLIATMTEVADLRGSWGSRTGPIDRPLIESVVVGLPAPVFYVAGPPGLVESMRRTLNDAGIEDDIRSEDFFGY